MKRLSRDEKMLKIISYLRKEGNFEKSVHRTEYLELKPLRYYYVDDEFFSIKYKDVEVYIGGRFELPSLDNYEKFNLDKWLNEILRRLKRKEA